MLDPTQQPSGAADCPAGRLGSPRRLIAVGSPRAEQHSPRSNPRSSAGGAPTYIGRGTYGTVYSEGDRAIKVVADYREFAREVSFLHRLRHPNVVPIIDQRVGSRYEIVMQLCDFPLSSCRGQLSPARCLAFAADIACGLSYIHSAGVMHRDIKPQNILVREGRAVICDFGCAIYTGAHIYSGRMQTLPYRAPEVRTQDYGRYTKKIDVWSFGCTVYELLTGRVLIKPERATSLDNYILSMRIMPTRRRAINLRIAGAIGRAYREEILRDKVYKRLGTAHPQAKIMDRLISVIGDCLYSDPRLRPCAGQLTARLSRGPVAQVGPAPDIATAGISDAMVTATDTVTAIATATASIQPASKTPGTRLNRSILAVANKADGLVPVAVIASASRLAATEAARRAPDSLRPYACLWAAALLYYDTEKIEAGLPCKLVDLLVVVHDILSSINYTW